MSWDDPYRQIRKTSLRFPLHIHPADVSFLTGSYLERMEHAHLHSNRGWTLVRDKAQLSPDEVEHIEYCERCHGWLAGFFDMARRAGFQVACNLPKLKKRDSRAG
jgi:hypothetical protein